MSNPAEKIVSDLIHGFEAHDLEAIVACFTDDAVYHNMPLKPVSGKDQIRATIQQFMPKSKEDKVIFKIVHTLSAGNIVINERVDIFETGAKHAELPVVGVFEIRDGKIAKWRDYFDMQSFTKQMA
jgi:limonene-1,2-epoxide hydrolase